MVYNALTQGVEVLGDVSVKENSQNDKFERVKESHDRFLEEVKAYKMEMEGIEKTLLK